jgi:hypothetical protein
MEFWDLAYIGAQTGYLNLTGADNADDDTSGEGGQKRAAALNAYGLNR